MSLFSSRSKKSIAGGRSIEEPQLLGADGGHGHRDCSGIGGIGSGVDRVSIDGPAYLGRLMESAMRSFEFEDNYMWAYNDDPSLRSGVCPFYCDFYGYQGFEQVPINIFYLKMGKNRCYQSEVEKTMGSGDRIHGSRKKLITNEDTEQWNLGVLCDGSGYIASQNTSSSSTSGER